MSTGQHLALLTGTRPVLRGIAGVLRAQIDTALSSTVFPPFRFPDLPETNHKELKTISKAKDVVSLSSFHRLLNRCRNQTQQRHGALSERNTRHTMLCKKCPPVSVHGISPLQDLLSLPENTQPQLFAPVRAAGLLPSGNGGLKSLLLPTGTT